jgi:hypothetical protein
MAGIHEKIGEYNKEILTRMAALLDLLPTAELKRHLLSMVKLIGERDDVFNNFFKLTMTGVQQHTDSINTSIKYMQFDLEATRRERDKYLRQLSGEQEDAG